MGKRSYTHTQILLPKIRAMVGAGKTQREIAEHFGFSSKEAVRELLKRERRKEAKLAAGIMPRPNGRPRKDAQPRDVAAEQAYECFILGKHTARNGVAGISPPRREFQKC